jgi:signal transduction histidine kinase
MDTLNPTPEAELAQLKERVRRLAEEKSHLQLLVHMLQKVGALPGLDNTVDALLHIVLESVGGTNVAIHYRVDSETFCMDLLGGRTRTQGVEDALARQAWESGRLAESPGNAGGAEAPMMNDALRATSDWAFPLLAGTDVVGVCKVEGVISLESTQLRTVLPVFFGYAAQVLRNKILGHSRLQRAFEEVSVAKAVLERQAGELSTSAALLRTTLESTREGILATRADGGVACFNQPFLRMWNLAESQVLDRTDREIFEAVQPQCLKAGILLQALEQRELRPEDDSYDLVELVDGRAFEHYCRVQRVHGEMKGRVWSFRNISERRALQQKVLLAQKQQAVGQLAAGIAHEINTPVQFVGDSISFLADSHRALAGVVGAYRQALRLEEGGPLPEGVLAAEEDADIPFILEQAPPACARARDGLARISSIVGAMMEFSAGGRGEEMTWEDINRALLATVTIAANEYRCIATLETSLGELPPVRCNISQLNQVFLHLLINASHAVAQVVGPGGNKGDIRVRTALEGEWVNVEVSDTGCGIPPEIRERVFDPFFTTKPVGKGSGQGLAIARSIVVDKHGGEIRFESTVGKGSTFLVRLPVGGPCTAAA